MKNISSSKFSKWTLGIAITILLALFYVVATNFILDKPEYSAFCEEKQVRVVPENKEQCLEVGGQWTEDQFIQKGIPRGAESPAPIAVEREGYCDPDFTCRQEYQVASETHERNFFIALTALGTLTLIASFAVRSVMVVAPALAAGGVLTLIIASGRYWSHMPDYLQVIVLAIALIALIGLGVWKFKPSEEPPYNDEGIQS